MNIETLVLGPLTENCYIVYQDNDAVLIDPGDEDVRIIDFLQSHQLQLSKILLTHAHYDHVGALLPLAEKYQPEIYLHKEDLWLYQNVDKQLPGFGLPNIKLPEISFFTNDQDEISFQNSSFQVMHTPGHTPGSVCYYHKSSNSIFTGDTLFKQGIGRTDLPGGSYSDLISSIKEKLFQLNNQVRVYAGHMEASTIEQERQYNPFFK